jgi:drug/metabolite transporter (DMT)-like permease
VSVVLAVLAALSYGVGDFSGAQAARARSPLWVLWVARLASLVALSGPLVFWNDGVVVGRDLLLGCVGGALISTAIWLMYRSMNLAPIHFATPIAAVLAASVPAVIGTALGERPKPIAVAGVLLAILSVAMISGLGRQSFGAHTKNERLALQLSVIAGVLYGLHSVVFSEISDRSGLWPVLAEQTTGFVGALALWSFLERRKHHVLPTDVGRGNLLNRTLGSRRSLGLAIVAGIFEVLAVVSFLEASRRGLLSVIGAVVALYPAPTILLAMLVLHERPTRRQAIGLAIALFALVAIGTGST